MSDQVRRRYTPRPDRPVAAVRLDFEANGFAFRYRKWGGGQRAKPGDWIVNNDDDVYTIDASVFAGSYRPVPERGPGVYVKTSAIFAERAQAPGVIKTREGSTQYQAGDYLVSSADDPSDRYAISAEKFERLYVLAEEPPAG
jgi:hypothetical protein